MIFYKDSTGIKRSVNLAKVEFLFCESREGQQKNYGIYILTGHREWYWWYRTEEDRDKVYDEMTEKRELL